MFFVFLLVAFLFLFFKHIIEHKLNIECTKPANGSLRENEQDYSQSYKQKYIFSFNEKSSYRKLASWAQERGYDVFPKMRLADIIEPRSREYFLPLFRKISQKHVDFVICDDECRIKFIIELDDNSHKQQERIERDIFVDQACRGAGYTIIHTRAISEEFLNNL